MKFSVKKQKLKEAREKSKSWHAKRKSLPANGQVLAKAEEGDEEGTEDEEDTMDEGDSPAISEPVVRFPPQKIKNAQSHLRCQNPRNTTPKFRYPTPHHPPLRIQRPGRIGKSPPYLQR